MNVREALRRADPAHRLPSDASVEPDERLLRQILDAPRAEIPAPGPAGTSPGRARRDRMPVIATGLVAIAVVVGAIVAIRAVPTAAPSPALSPTTSASALEAAVDAKLAAAAGTGRLDPDLPFQTWTDAAEGAQGGMIDLTGRTLYLAAACTGGGAVTIRIDEQRDTTIDCTTSSAIGPIDLTALTAKAKKGLGLDIVAAQGDPRFFAKAVAVPGSDVTTTPSVQVDGRTLLVYPASGAGGNQALLHGKLTRNAAGCITVGDRVIVAPSNVELLPDGSLRLDGTTVAAGSTISLGGGVAASIPIGSPCHAATGEYFIVGDYPQPQRD